MLLYLSNSGGHTCFPNLGCSHSVATRLPYKNGWDVDETWMSGPCAAWTLKTTIYCNQVYGGIVGIIHGPCHGVNSNLYHTACETVGLIISHWWLVFFCETVCARHSAPWRSCPSLLQHQTHSKATGICLPLVSSSQTSLAWLSAHYRSLVLFNICGAIIASGWMWLIHCQAYAIPLIWYDLILQLW